MNTITIFKLTHIREQGEYKHLGYFSSLDSAAEAVEQAKTLPGFRDFPAGFVVEPANVQFCKASPSVVFRATIYFHDEDYLTEYIVPLGVYCSKLAAEDSIVCFWRNNGVDFDISYLGEEMRFNESIIAESTADRCVIGELEWRYGFNEEEKQKLSDL